MASRNITIRQVEIVTTIRNMQHLNGYTPSIRELCATLRKARGTVFKQLRSLEKKGVIRRHAGKARAIEVLTPA
jgi:SOS-response transcriptional repressor LexA